MKAGSAPDSVPALALAALGLTMLGGLMLGTRLFREHAELDGELALLRAAQTSGPAPSAIAPSGEIARLSAEYENETALLRAAEAAKVQGQERARIMQDMHDGLGSQLVSSLAMAQSGEMSSAQTYDVLRSCIDDLRLAIDTSSDSRDSLSLALANLRFRMEPRLKAAGIALRWNTLGLNDSLPLPAEAKLPLLRIIQESLTNTLKHAGAKTLSVTVHSADAALQIDISDDGCGFDVATARQTAQGKGLNSLDKRARVLGATLDVISSPQGTRTSLHLPL